jgi:hypothetical protein
MFWRDRRRCFDRPDRRKVNPFTDLRQSRFFPSVPPHCSNAIAMQHGLWVKWVDKISPLG